MSVRTAGDSITPTTTTPSGPPPSSPQIIDVRRIGQEIEFDNDSKGQRKRVHGDMREHYHKFYCVDVPSVIYEDNDICEVLEEDGGKWANSQFREGARREGVKSRLFIIESIFIAHERKFMEGWWISKDNPKLVDDSAPATILCRQTIRKASESRVAETTGSMKKAREKYDKAPKPNPKAEAEKEKPKERKKPGMPDFSKPSRFGDGIHKKGKKGSATQPSSAEQKNVGGWVAYGVSMLRYVTGLPCCGSRAKGPTPKPSSSTEAFMSEEEVQ